MYKIYFTIILIAIFCFKQSLQTKTYKIKLENQLEFNAQRLQSVIADFWNINN